MCGQAFDAKSGYRTKTILAMLIRGSDKSPIGVVQVINKEEGQAFDEKDEGTLSFFLGIAGPILHHSQLLSSMSKVKEQTAEADFSVQVGVAACHAALVLYVDIQAACRVE